LIGMGSLGRLFRNRLEAFPGTPYLRPRAPVREAWAARLGARRARLRVGVSWRGGTPKTGGARRSVTLDQLAPVLDLPDCEFVSLQYGDVSAELAAANDGRDNPIKAFPAAEIDDFEQLAGLVLALDVVVSVQTSVVHLSGAVGAECLALLPHIPEWRYTLGAPAMPWYRSVRLIRQSEPGAWAPVIGRVAEALRQRLAA
jgi:ADP-heptose:LPS heptosyltransferase